MPRGRALFARMAWPRRTDFPNPAGATTVVARWSHRASRRSSRAERTTALGTLGGPGASARPDGNVASSLVGPGRIIAMGTSCRPQVYSPFTAVPDAPDMALL